MVGDREKVIDAGFDGYIAKPIDPETFVREVESYLPGGGPHGVDSRR
jgi:two-component system cell cycle response regulator